MKTKILVLILFILSLWSLYGYKTSALPSPNLLQETTNTTITNTITVNTTVTNTITQNITLTNTIWETTTITGTVTENATNVITTTMTIISLTTHSITTTLTTTMTTGTINYFEANFYSLEIEGLKEVYLNESGKYLAFSKYNNNLTDADNIVANLQLPNGSVISLPVFKKETGVYEVNINFNNLGTYVLRISGSCKGLNSEDGIAILCRKKEIEKSDLEKLKANYTLQISILQNEINKLKQQGNLLNQTLLAKIDKVENELRNLIKEINHNVTNRISLNEANVNRRISDLNSTILFLKEASGNQYKSLYNMMNNTQNSVNASLSNALSSFRELSGSLYNSFERFLGDFSKNFNNNFMVFGFSLACIMLVGFGAMFMMNRSFITALRGSIREFAEKIRTSQQIQPAPPQIVSPPPQPPPTINPYPQSNQIQKIEIPHKNIVIKEAGLKEEEELTAEELRQFNELFKQFLEERRRIQEKLGKTIEKKHNELKNLSRLYKNLSMVGGNVEEEEGRS